MFPRRSFIMPASLALIHLPGCVPAHSADGTGAVQVACALYEAAVAKYEAVLEMDPRNRAILRNCAFALYDLGRLQPDPSSKTARQLLEVSCHHITIFQDQVQIAVPACLCFSRGFAVTQACQMTAFDVWKEGY